MSAVMGKECRRLPSRPPTAAFYRDEWRSHVSSLIDTQCTQPSSQQGGCGSPDLLADMVEVGEIPHSVS